MIPPNQKTILIVEDDFILAKMGQKTLEQCGYNSIVANTGEEAIDIFNKTNAVDLILMDIDLGSGIDGTEAAAIILKDFDIPVVFLSSHTEPEIVEKTEKITSYGYVVKGTGITVLDASIKMAFKLFDSRKKELEKEKALQKTEIYYRTVADFTYDWEYWQGPDGNFIYVSPSCKRVTGYTAEEFMQNPGLMVKITHPDDPEKLVAHFHTYNTEEKDSEQHDIDFRILTKNNEEKWISHSCQRVYNKNGDYLGRRASNRDITERKRHEELIKQNESRLRRIVNILQHSSDTIQEFLDYALGQVIELTESKVGYIYHYHEDSKEFVLNTWSKDVMAECSIINPLTCYELEKTGIWGEAVRQHKPIIVNDFQSENHLRKGYPKGHVQLTKFMTIPVFVGDKIVGVVGLANKISDYTESDILQASLLMEAVWKVITKMKAEDALRESEELHAREASLLTTLLENLPVGVFLVDSNNGKPLVSNETACRLLGRGILPDASKNNLAEVYKAFRQKTRKPYPLEEMPIILGMQGKSSHVEDMLVVRPDGTETLLEIFGCPIIDKHGKPWASLVSFQDITERKSVEESLCKSEARFRTLFEKANDGIIILSNDLEIFEINESFAEMHGYTVEEMKSIKLHNLDVEDLSQKAPDRIRRIMAGENIRFDVKHYHKDGHVIDLDVSSCLLTLKNENYIVAFHRDITERKHYEEGLIVDELRSANDKLEALWNISSIIKSDSKTVCDYTLSKIVQMTESKFGFYGFINENESVMTIFSWSGEAMKNCSMVDKPTYFKICEAGVWADAVRQRKPLILNDYSASYPSKKGYPQGHVELINLMVVPVFNEEKIVSLAAVANKNNDYDENDLKQLNSFMLNVQILIDRQKKDEKIKTLLTEKELLLKEVHHRIKNNMNTVAGILSLQIDTLKEPTAISALNDARSRVQSMMLLYDKLYRSDDLKEISFKEYVSPLVDEIVGNFPNKAIVKIEKNIDDNIMMDPKKMSHLGLIINELLTNIMKYAFASRNNGLIKISALKKDNHTTISVQDNGVGIPESIDVGTSNGFGLQLVYMMTKQLQGTIKIERNSGTKFILEFNL